MSIIGQMTGQQKLPLTVCLVPRSNQAAWIEFLYSCRIANILCRVVYVLWNLDAFVLFDSAAEPVIEVLASELGKASHRASLLSLATTQARNTFDSTWIAKQILCLLAALLNKAGYIRLLHLVVLGIVGEAIIGLLRERGSRKHST